MDEDINDDYKTLNQAYSDLVAHSIVTVHMYEEYLLGKATSKELAITMTALLKALPTDYKGTKLKKPRKATRRPSKRVSGSRRPPVPPERKDVQRGKRDE